MDRKYDSYFENQMVEIVFDRYLFLTRLFRNYLLHCPNSKNKSHFNR